MTKNGRAEYDARQIARAKVFTATLFLGRERGFYVEQAPSLAEAEALAASMPARLPACNRRPMIYAVTPEGISIHVR